MTILADKITTTDVKRFNKNRIFRLIHDSERISRQEIADLLQLSLPTVNQNLKALTDQNLIQFGGNFDSTGGRKAQAITVNGMAKCAVSINITNTGINVALVDLKGDVICSEKRTEPFRMEKDYADILVDLVNDIVKRNHMNDQDVLGIGITVPGIFDRNNSVVLSAPTLGIRDYDVSALTKKMPYHCLFMNDARASAYAEFWFNHEQEQDMQLHVSRYHIPDSTVHKPGKIYLMLNDGVGGCYIDDGAIRRGEHNRFGEFGHMTIHPSGKKCNCGKNGCLEAYVSARTLSSELNITLDEFFIELHNGNIAYQEIFDEYINNLVIGINNIYMMFDSEIVVGGPVAKYLDPYKNIITEKLIQKYSFDTDGSYFEFAKCSPEQSDTGAALMFLGRFISAI